MSLRFFCTQYQILLKNSLNISGIILNTVCFILPIGRTISGTKTPDENGAGSNSNKLGLYVPQITYLEPHQVKV